MTNETNASSIKVAKTSGAWTIFTYDASDIENTMGILARFETEAQARAAADALKAAFYLGLARN